MEKLKIETIGNAEPVENSHEQAVSFVESHRNILEHYARGGIVIEPAPPSLSMFAFDLEKNTIYINSMFYKELGLRMNARFLLRYMKLSIFWRKNKSLLRTVERKNLKDI